MRHFALSRLYLHCREKASVTDNCLEDPSPAPAAVVVARLKNWVGWLCFKWDFRLVVLPLFVATVFKQSRHTGSFTLIGSPLSFGLKTKCSHTGAEDWGFETSRVTCVTLVLWVGNETLRWTLRERPLRTESENPYRITPIHWLMARRRLWRNDVVRSYWRTRHPLLRFLCRKESCRQREELGSKRSVSFPTQRTRVTQVTRDVLFHR